MTIRASHFSPKVLISAPRRSAGVPNSNGTYVLFTVSTYSFETHSKSYELRVLDTRTNESTLLSEDQADSINWLDEDSFIWFQSGEDGATDLYHGSVSSFLQGPIELGQSHYLAGSIPAPAGDLKVAKLGDGKYALALSAQASRDGQLFNPEKADKPQSSGRLYTGLFVRHWDSYEGAEKNSLWYGKLSKDGKGGKFTLSTFSNALKGTNLESPLKPFGGTDNFDISPRGIVFVSKDPDLNPALNTKCNVYLLNVESWTQSTPAKPKRVVVEGFEGASTSPVFSPDALKVAFLSMKRNGYESDLNRIFVVGDLDGTELQASNEDELVTAQSGWDRSPSSISWTADGKGILATAEDEGHNLLFFVQPGQWSPLRLTEEGSVGDVKPLKDSSKIFFTASSLIDSSYFSIIQFAPGKSQQPALASWSNSYSNNGTKFGLKPIQISSIWTPASNPKVNKEVHSWVVKPSNFDSSKTYPVAYLIHGGPQGAWGDSWSTRWNPAVFAEQGFIVVAPNITGSTGYGQAFTDAINKNWGGDPYEDIVNLFDWVGKHLPEADNDRAVALGASYGGYMMNWIQGHPLGRKFRALVCHDGIFSTGNMLSTEELYFPLFDLGGTPWYDPDFSRPKSLTATTTSPTPTPPTHQFPTTASNAWQKWDPSAHLSSWSTPQLVIHSSKDYRICISEGLAAFNVLQARGVESQLLSFPDENHFVLKPENSLVWHRTVLGWIRGHVGLEGLLGEV